MTEPARPSPGSGVSLARGLGWFSIGLGLAELVATDFLARMVGLPDRGRNRGLLRAFGAREVASGIGILANPADAGWVWSRVAGDAMDLGCLWSALGSRGADRKRVLASLGAVAGMAGLDVYCASRLGTREGAGEHRRSIEVREATIVAAPAATLYAFWRDFRNLPRFMEHLLAVEIVDERRSRWTAAGPDGSSAEWEAEIVEDQPNRFIAWRSTGATEVDNRGTVTFAADPGGQSTEVRIELRYAPPGGRLGRVVATLMGDDPARQVRTDLRTLRRLIEAGEPLGSEART
jgi:uncharacterized membrane protein